MQDGVSGWAAPGLFSFNDFGIGLERVQSGLRTKWKRRGDETRALILLYSQTSRLQGVKVPWFSDLFSPWNESIRKKSWLEGA
jgi:hypothetical protein